MSVRRRSADTVEDAAHLLAAGESPERVCARIGLTPSGVAMAAYRAGRPDLAATFNRLRTRPTRPYRNRRYVQTRSTAA